MILRVEQWSYPTDEEGGEHQMEQAMEFDSEQEALAWVAKWLDEGFAVRWYRI